MSLVHVKITIDAPVQRVWDTVMDPNRLEEWVTIHRDVRNVSAQPLEQGATMDQVMHVRGLSFRVHWTLVEMQAPTYAEWDGRGPAHSRARIRYQLSGDNDEATEFEYTNEFTPPGGRLGNLASRVIVGAASEREAHNSLTKLKVLVENP
jgi:uncharacterized protein YndB with AHSA1/START domain